MRKVQIGWVIVQRFDRKFHSNVRVYATKATAQRYARSSPVVPCYVDVPDDMTTAKG
jgi:hypothetical protein